MMIRLSLCLALLSLSASVLSIAEEPAFESELFDTGTLLYADSFSDGEVNREFWEPRTKSWEIIDGNLVGKRDYETKEEAMKALGRDHHLGLSPVIRLNQLPEKFVVHLRLKYEGIDFAPVRPKFDIGHHINVLHFTASGYSIKLHGGEVITGTAPNVKVNEWLDVELEFQEGKMFIKVNGEGLLIEHEQVSLQGHSEFTFKTFAEAPNRIFFDSVRLWKAE